MKHNLPIKIDLPEHFLDEEVRCEHLVTSKMKKVWAVEIDILFQIKTICERHNIKWFVEGGTLLGAVRHKGFIPWDDDIDIVMLREDYERFIYYAEQELGLPYFLQTQKTDPQCLHGHVQVRNSLTTGILKSDIASSLMFNQGIFVDIFPLDNIPDNIEKAKKVVTKSNLLKQKAIFTLHKSYLYQNLHFRKNLVKLVYNYFEISYHRMMCKCRGFKYTQSIYNKFEQSMVKYNEKKTHHVTYYPLGWSDRKFFITDWFLGQIVYLPFEWFKVPAMNGYIEYLNTLYGDWYKVVKGGSMHGEVLFDTEKPYTYYTNNLCKNS